MSFNPAKGPCKGCPNRKVACHSHCQEYQEWRETYDEAKRQKEVEADGWSRASYARHVKYLRKYGRSNI